MKKIFKTNDELYYTEEYSMQNLYYFLYSLYADDNDSHFARRDDNWTHDEIRDICIDFLNIAYGAENTGAFFSKDVLQSYILPSQLKPAIEEICNILGVNANIVEYTTT